MNTRILLIDALLTHHLGWLREVAGDRAEVWLAQTPDDVQAAIHEDVAFDFLVVGPTIAPVDVDRTVSETPPPSGDNPDLLRQVVLEARQAFPQARICFVRREGLRHPSELAELVETAMSVDDECFVETMLAWLG